MNIKKNNRRAASLQILTLIFSIAFSAVSCVQNDETKPESIDIEGSWQGSGNNIVITSSNRTTKSYLGTAPKTDYVGNVSSFSNQGKTYIFSGKELDYAAWPTIGEKTNTIFERNKWSKTDANTFYLCTEAFNKATLELLNADTTSYTFDPANPTANNCGAGAWDKYTRNP